MRDEEKNYRMDVLCPLENKVYIEYKSVFYFKIFLWLFVPLYNTIALNVTVTDTIAKHI